MRAPAQGRAASGPVLLIPCGPLAQSVEQKTFNLLVEGSNPSRPTTFLNDQSIVIRFYQPQARHRFVVAFRSAWAGSNPSRLTTFPALQSTGDSKSSAAGAALFSS
jgi:hypothetical protein